jgi:hypothetical protein
VSIYQRDPAAPGANVRRRQLDSPDVRLDRAVTRFNASEAARTVAGLTRSLGRPRVSVGAAAGSPDRVRITVAWELCWYQWVVGLDGDVVEIGRGEEVGQLDASAQHWNTSVGEGSQLLLGSLGPRRRRGWLRRR